MTFDLYKSGSKRPLSDPQVYTGGTRRPVMVVYAYAGGQRYTVWARQLLEASASATAWDTIRLTMVLPGVGADAMTITEGARTVYTGAPKTTHDDGGSLLPSTAYTYTVVTTKAGAETGRITCSATTPARADMGLTKGTTAWDSQVMTWTDPDKRSVDAYKVFRGSTQVYSGTTKTFTDTGLSANTAYTWTLRAYRAGVEIPTADTLSATTSVYPDLGLSASVLSYSQIKLSWAAKVGSIDEFILKRDGTTIYTGLGTTHTDTGLAASSGYSYALYARRDGVQIKSDSTSASTPARPTSSGAAYGPACCSGYAWAQSTAKHLGGPNFTLSGGGTNYISAFNNRITGYGTTGKFSPHIGGHTYPTQYPGSTAAGSPGWSDIGGENRALGNGTHGTYTDTGGDSNYKSQWQAWSGGSYSSQISWGQVNYWWYTSLLADEELLAAGLFGRDLHVVTLGDWDGNIIAKRAVDKVTRELLYERGDLVALAKRERQAEREIGDPALRARMLALVGTVKEDG